MNATTHTVGRHYWTTLTVGLRPSRVRVRLVRTLDKVERDEVQGRFDCVIVTNGGGVGGLWVFGRLADLREERS